MNPGFNLIPASWQDSKAECRMVVRLGAASAIELHFHLLHDP